MTMNVGTNSGKSHSSVPLVPPADWHDLDAHAHTVQLYEDDSFLLDELSRYIGSALGAGDAAVVIATQAHRDGLAKRLEGKGLDIALATRQGRYVSLDAAETLAKFMVDGWPDASRFADVIGDILAGATAASFTPGKNGRKPGRPHAERHPRVAAFGEMVALLWAQGKSEAAIRVEQYWNNLAETHTFHLRCAYPLGLFPRAADGPALAEMCLAHSHVIPAEDYSVLMAEADRARAIAILQQKAQALQAEIEERKKVQQALRESNKDLHKAVKTRDIFLSVAAHELRTPITTLRGFAQLLQRDIERNREISPQRFDAALDAIEGQTRKLTQLVGRLLDSAQIEAGKLRIEPVTTDLVSLVRSVLEQQRGSANHQIIFDAPEHLEAVVDPLRFEQVITNLLDNAVKFSPQGGKVTVGLEQIEGGGIRLSVTDEGVGIPAGEREHLFDRFHQAHAERHLSGLGLGLYITREIVELHGGRVRIEQPVHPGTRFVVELPSRGQELGVSDG